MTNKNILIIQLISILPIVLAIIFPIAPHGDNYLLLLACNLTGIINLIILIIIFNKHINDNKKIEFVNISFSIFFLVLNIFIIISLDFQIFIMELFN